MATLATTLDGTDVKKEGDWRDSAGKALTYTNWGKDQPSNAYGNENYLHYWDTLNGKHNDAAGSLEENIICVKPLSGKIYFEPKLKNVFISRHAKNNI